MSLHSQYNSSDCNSKIAAHTTTPSCLQLQSQYGIIPNQTWGSAGADIQLIWGSMNCDVGAGGANQNPSSPAPTQTTFVPTQPLDYTSPNYSADQPTVPYSYGPGYPQKVLAHGVFPIVATTAVNPQALAVAKAIVEGMISPDIAGKMAAYNETQIIVVATGESVVDHYAFAFLKEGDPTNFDGRKWADIPALGGTLWHRSTSFAELNLLHLAGDGYTDENTAVHEFGHAVMNIYIATQRPDLLDRLSSAYNAALSSGKYIAGSYCLHDDMEYWAEGTQLYLGATRRTDSDSTGGMTHDRLPQDDPSLFAILEEIYGSNPWQCRSDQRFVCFVNETL